MDRLGQTIVAFLALVVPLALLCSSGRADAANPNDWPMYQHDIGRTGYDPIETKINRTAVGLLRLKCAFHSCDSCRSHDPQVP